MSSNVLTHGVMVPLVRPVGVFTTENWEGFQEFLDEIGLEVNYEGTLIYTQTSQEGCGIYLSDPKHRDEMIALCKKEGIRIHEDQMQFYVSYWYNGADSYMSDMTIDKFNETLGE